MRGIGGQGGIKNRAFIVNKRTGDRESLLNVDIVIGRNKPNKNKRVGWIEIGVEPQH